MTHRFNNWKKDTPDHRDYWAHEQFKLRASALLPSQFDMRPLMSPVEDQGQLGSCTGNAIVGAMEYLENKAKQKYVDLSRLFVYYNERVIEGTVSEDAGAEIRDGIKSLVQYGVCTEKLCKYDITKFARKPTKTAYKNALTRRIKTYARVVQTSTGIRQALASGYPVIFGFMVYASFESAEVAKTGMVPMPRPNEEQLGGHAVLIVGYDDAQQRYIVRNSWGAEWGDKGYFYMPYGYVHDPALSDDFWTVQL